MSIHIDRLITEIVPAPEPEGAPTSPPANPWGESDRQRAALAALARNARRTHAEDYDD